MPTSLYYLLVSILIMNQTSKASVYFLFLNLLLFSNSPIYAACDITHAIYKDINNKGFELRFNDPPQNSAVLFATVTLWHPKRGNINNFEVGSSQGFGTVYLFPKSPIESETVSQISAYFFDSNFQELDRPEISTHIFISGLGSWDWYENQMSGSRDTVLGNPMWKFDRCQ